jgi:hypothetical protein
MTPLNEKHEISKYITDVWNVSKEELMKIYEKLLYLEDNLNVEHKGQYFDYQIVEDFFPKYSDLEKAMIFLYGQWVHDRFYKNNI